MCVHVHVCLCVCERERIRKNKRTTETARVRAREVGGERVEWGGGEVGGGGDTADRGRAGGGLGVWFSLAGVESSATW